MTPLERTTNNQRIAADPARSVFVMANAGAGKTRVLTDRVARLLLSGAMPDRILCITFTKAAAAEMAERLFKVLGEWALADDEKLIAALSELEGEQNKTRPAEELARARRLFAQALETPGGLKIQTIHSFCERVLRRFPIEAGTPPSFSVLEDSDGAALLNSALDQVAADAARDQVIATSFATLSETRNEDQLRSLLIQSAGDAEIADLEAALTALATELSVDPQAGADDIKRAYIESLSGEDIRRMHDGLSAEGKQPQDAAARLAPYFSPGASATAKWDALFALLFTKDGAGLRKAIASSATDKHDPWVRNFIGRLGESFVAVMDQLKAAFLYRDSAAFLRLVVSVRERYGKMKEARAALDFDDLVDRVRKLFHSADSEWIMYKLDYGVDHILIDEAQDTSPEQWAVVESLLEEYLSGAGVRPRARSFFAVGDMKQSIYSFQGADVGLYQEKEQRLSKSLSAVTTYKNVPLDMSFRTTAPVLAFVDEVFAPDAAAEGLGAKPQHSVMREREAGLVELWPLTPRPEREPIEPWDAPVDSPGADHPARVLCDRIAATVKGWLDNAELLESRGRPVRAGDILILVQSRGPLFHMVIQRLSVLGVPVAGPDRLAPIEDPAVEDLVSYARFALSPPDDLSLAEILKSPLFGFDDDNDLFALGFGRALGETLWNTLNTRCDEQPNWRRAADELSAARAVARREGPYAFFNHALEAGSPSGRRRFFDRLGKASADALDELLRQALDFENANPRSLRVFLNWFEASSSDIKREMDRENDSVRVMTVHGAKGLEADIVFLLDAHKGLNKSHVGPVFPLPENSPALSGVSILAPSEKADAPLSATLREAALCAAYEEYRRLFYVAATRARDRLYICGIEQSGKANKQETPVGEKSWHALSLDAFDRLDRVEHGATAFWAGSDAPLLRLSCPQSKEPKDDGAERLAAADVIAPAWLHRKAAPEASPQRLTPSNLLGEEETEWQGDGAGAAYSPAGSDKYFRGRVLHRLLELLPDAAPEDRAAAADRLLARLAPDIGENDRAAWRDEVLTVLNDPAFAEVFAPGSMAETPIAGSPGGTNIFLNGQIDRLAISGGRVLVVDYKTNRPPPARIEEADPAYIAQLAAYRALLQEIYPEYEIACALLWTYDARLMEVPSEMLDHAFARMKQAG